MKAIHPLKAAISVGVLLAAWHAGWAVLVALGWAQYVIDFIFSLHFIRPVYVVQPFHFGLAAGLVALTFMIGLAVGFIFAVIWNRLHLE